ncbi:MAG: efflux RND transporter periplasmic adaptor subunit [Thermoanaerobaculia bacterium]|nr:efflux RND transporter periplasmic adaptor subunit [Thermoanaerobaculia bacterium]
MKIRIGIALLAAALAVACGKHEASDATDGSGAPRVAARLATAERADLAERTEISGTVVAEKSTAVSSRVMALVTAVPVQLGESVRSGQTLVAIDATAAEGQVAQARGGLAQAEAALALAQRNHERFQALAASESASELELDLARMQYEQAKGAVEQAQGAVDAARSVARESRVVAPFAGRVTQKLIEVGDLAAPGRPLVMLESAAGRRVALAVPERFAARPGFALGEPLAVRIDARPDLGEIEGRIVEISPGPDPVTHSYTVKVAVDTPDLPAGSAARGLLPGEARATVLIPGEAVVRAGGLTLVVVREADGQAQTRVVSLGERLADGRVEVLAGLAGGEQVALGLPSAPPAGAILEESRS